MSDIPSPVSLALPERKQIEAYVVTLADGRKVLRTKDELTPAPRK